MPCSATGRRALGLAAGLGVLATCCRALGALGVVVALVVALLQNGVGLGFGLLVPVLGGLWVAGGSAASGDAGRSRSGPYSPCLSPS